jgi:hypothetical protein
MRGLDVACMAVPWLYFLGTNIASGALLAKTKAVHQVNRLKFCEVGTRSQVSPFVLRHT